VLYDDLRTAMIGCWGLLNRGLVAHDGWNLGKLRGFEPEVPLPSIIIMIVLIGYRDGKRRSRLVGLCCRCCCAIVSRHNVGASRRASKYQRELGPCSNTTER